MSNPVEHIRRYQTELTAFRRDIHAHPELAFEESRTSDRVAEQLGRWGIEVHRGLAKTGLVGVIPGRRSARRAVGLRADMDCLPMHETAERPYKSRNAGRMHACGHDGHTTMLLGAARYLSETRNFAGTAYVIFQPAEEHGGGGNIMVQEGLFERFPADEVYALHNWPGLPAGQIAVRAGGHRWGLAVGGGREYRFPTPDVRLMFSQCRLLRVSLFARHRPLRRASAEDRPRVTTPCSVFPGDL